MLQDFKSSARILKDSFFVFKKYPVLSYPLILSAIIECNLIIYLQYHFDGDDFSTEVLLLIIFGVLLILSVVMSFACSIVVELSLAQEV